MQPHHKQNITEAVARKDWDSLEILAFQQENLACQAIREHLGKGGFPPPSSAQAQLPGDEILVTGGAGFIGSNVTRRLLEDGFTVIAIDEFNDYYNVAYKYDNVAPFLGHPNYEIYPVDFRDLDALKQVFRRHNIRQILHLGARAGVRPSVEIPQLYVTTNVLGTQNLLEMAREFKVENFVYASSSSVYGASKDFPLSETQRVDHPISPYAATKKANEVQASAYAQLFGLPVTGLRFFTVYGPGGRPDMSIRKFMESLDRNEPIPMFGDGTLQRDFTYIDDIVDGITKALGVSRGKKGWDEVFNLGESRTTTLRRMILLIAESVGKFHSSKPIEEMTEDEAAKEIDRLVEAGLVVRKPVPLGDVPKTFADISKAQKELGYDPHTLLPEGIRKTAQWHFARKTAGQHPSKHAFSEAIIEHWKLRDRAALDHLGRHRDPAYTEEDLFIALDCVDTFEKSYKECPSANDKLLALRLSHWSWETVGWIASYLPQANEPRAVGLGRFGIHRKRKRLIQMLRDSGHDPLSGSNEEAALALAREIVFMTGPRERAIVVAAAGYGSRVADRLGGREQKHRLFLGDEMILVSLRNVAPFAKRIVVVASENNRKDIETRLEASELNSTNGYRVDFVTQKHRLGDGDAHLTAWKALKKFDGIVLFVFADAPTKSPHTIEKMLLLKEALGHIVPLVVPCESDENPYSPIVLANSGPDRGRALWNWQKADEQDSPEAAEARRAYGLRNVGLFTAETSVFQVLQEYKDSVFCQTPRHKRWEEAMTLWETEKEHHDKKPKEPEFGFADLMKILPQRGVEVAAANLALPTDKLNVNSPEDADKVRGLLRSRSPYCTCVIERVPENNEIYVKFLDLDDQRNMIEYRRTPSLRHCTRFVFPVGTNLDDPEIVEKIQRHVRETSSRIEAELGIEVSSFKLRS